MATRKPIKTAAPQRKPADTGKSSGGLTSERISHDLEAFRKAGGKIEVLGTTRVLTRVAEPEVVEKKRRAG